MATVDPTIASRARQLSAKHGLVIDGTPVEENGIFEGDLGYVEHCIHELAHAMMLGLPFAGQISSAVSGTLARHEDGGEYQIWHEGAAWAIEWHALLALGVDLHWNDITAGAEVQGVPLDMLHRMVQQRWARTLGNLLAAFMRGES